MIYYTYLHASIYTVFQKSDAKIQIIITIRHILSELNILLAALIIIFLM